MDLTTLGIGVDSSKVDDANRRLDDFATKAGRAEEAAKRVGGGAQQGAKGFDELEGAMTRASIKGNVVGDMIQAGVQRAIDAVKALYSLMSQVGDFQDFADMTGATAVNIAKLQTSADVAGVSMGTLTGYMSQMTRVLSLTDEEGDRAAQALAKIGINFREFQQLDPAERMATLGQAMANYSDGVGKAEVMQALFGARAREVGKVLKELGDEQAFTTMLTDDMIAAVDDLNDSNARLASQTRQWIQFVVAGATPALSAFMGAIGDAVNEALGLGNASTALGANKGIEVFAIGAARFLAQLVEAGQVVYRVFEGLGSGIRSLAEAASAAKNFDLKGIENAFAGHAARVKEIMNRELFSVTFERNLDKYRTEQVQRQYDVENGLSRAVTTGVDTRGRARQREADRAQRELERIAKAAEKAAQREREAQEKARMQFGREDAIRQGEAVLEANRKYQESLEKTRKLQADIDEEVRTSEHEQTTAILAKAQHIEEEIRTRGMLRSQIEEERLAVMERDRAEVDGNEAAMAALDKRIDAQKRLIAAIKGQEVIEETERTAKAMGDTFDKTWDHVGQSLADAIMKGGMSAREFLERTFNTLVLKPMIQAGVTGFLGGSGAGIAAAGGSPLGQITGSLLGGVGSLFGAGGFGGALASGAGWLTGATTFGGAIGAGASLIGTGTAGGIASGLGMLAGALGPIALGIWGLNKIFGGKGGGPKAEGSAGFMSGSLIGNLGNDLDKNAAEAVRALNDTYKRLAATLGATRDVQFGVGMSMDPRGTAPSFIDIRASDGGGRTRTDVGRSEEEFAAALAEMSTSVLLESLKASGIDREVLAYFEHISAGLTGEAKLAALEQAAAVRTVRDAIGQLTTFTTGLATSSMMATQNIIEFAGGIDRLAAGLAAYRQNFFNDIEQRDMALADMAKQLNAPGSGWQGFTKELLATWDKNFFRQVVEGINVSTELGQRQFASMMNVAGMFAQIENAAEAAGIAAQQAAEAERARAAAEAERARQERIAEYERRKSLYERALSDLESAYNRQKDSILRVRDAMHAATKSFQAFNDSIRVDQNLTMLTPGERMTELRRQYEVARLEMERDEFSSDSVNRAQQAARALLQGGREFYGSGAGYQSLYDMVIKQMDEAAKETAKRETNAEAQLRKLDQQVGYLHIISNTLISVERAIANVNSARQFMLAGYPHQEGLSFVPFDKYPALLHKGEAVLPPAQSSLFRNMPDLAVHLQALLQEISMLRKENRQDAGNTIGATFDATAKAAQMQSEATLRAARQRAYMSRGRPVLA